jgi:hypothetical protein
MNINWGNLQFGSVLSATVISLPYDSHLTVITVLLVYHMKVIWTCKARMRRITALRLKKRNFLFMNQNVSCKLLSWRPGGSLLGSATTPVLSPPKRSGVLNLSGRRDTLTHVPRALRHLSTSNVNNTKVNIIKQISQTYLINWKVRPNFARQLNYHLVHFLNADSLHNI